MIISKKELEDIKKIIKKNEYGYDTNNDINYSLRSYFEKKKCRSKSSSGGYANVFIPKNRDYVIKMIRRNDNKSYTDYAKYCIKYAHVYDNLPKIYSKFLTQKYEVYIVEKLSHNDRKSERFIKKYVEYDAHGSLFVSKHNPISPILKKIKTIISIHGGSNDMYGSNIMVRKDGTEVITDPIAD